MYYNYNSYFTFVWIFRPDIHQNNTHVSTHSAKPSTDEIYPAGRTYNNRTKTCRVFERSSFVHLHYSKHRSIHKRLKFLFRFGGSRLFTRATTTANLSMQNSAKIANLTATWTATRTHNSSDNFEQVLCLHRWHSMYTNTYTYKRYFVWRVRRPRVTTLTECAGGREVFVSRHVKNQWSDLRSYYHVLYSKALLPQHSTD